MRLVACSHVRPWGGGQAGVWVLTCHVAWRRRGFGGPRPGLLWCGTDAPQLVCAPSLGGLIGDPPSCPSRPGPNGFEAFILRPLTCHVVPPTAAHLCPFAFVPFLAPCSLAGAVWVGSYLLFATAGPAFPDAYPHTDGGVYRGQWRGMQKEGLGVYT